MLSMRWMTWGMLWAVVAWADSGTLAAEPSPAGRLYLVGIGPGDPELMTFKTAKILKAADRVYCFQYLRLDLARWTRPEAIHVASPLLMAKFIDDHGRRLPPELRDKAAQAQAEVARFVPELRALLAAGKTVVLADAGDPTIYCPWSWTCRMLADLSPTVVPGLSAFNAGNAALCGGVTPCPGAVMITCGATLAPTDADGRLRTTVVLFTHRLTFPDAIARLKARYPADTRVAVVADASLATQSVHRGTLATIADNFGPKPPSGRYLIYVGDKLP